MAILNLENGVPFAIADPNDLVGIPFSSSVIQWLAEAGSDIPPYWSRERDKFLRTFAAKNDAIGVAVSTFVEKFLTIPFTVYAKNPNIQTHVRQANALQKALMQNSGVSLGWRSEISKFLTDYLVTDNGSFLLLMGDGPANGPIVGPVTGVYHLDSRLVTRTSNHEFPIRYANPFDNKEYKIHFGRLIALSHHPSPDALLLNIGRSPVSLCINAASEIHRIVRYYEQKMGARPARQLLYVKEGATLDQLTSAVDAWRVKMDAEGNDLFSQTLLVAPRTASQKLDLALLDLASTPDGFNRHDTVTMDMSIIAAAFGMDLRDFAMGAGLAGQTRADADTSVLKAHSKGVAAFIGDFLEQILYKIVPAHLNAGFDYVDDSQDERRSLIMETRSKTRGADLSSGVLSPRVARMQMLEYTELTVQQFNELELADGRLPNGLDVVYLFYTKDEHLRAMVDCGVPDPLDMESYDVEEMLDTIEERIMAVSRIVDDATNVDKDLQARSALAALTKLKNRLQGVMPAGPDENTLNDGQLLLDNQDAPAKMEGADNHDTTDNPTPTDVPEDAMIAKSKDDDSPTAGDIRHARGRLKGILRDLFDAD